MTQLVSSDNFSAVLPSEKSVMFSSKKNSDSDMGLIHTPVFLERTLELMRPAIESVENPILVDATLGMGGHSLAFLEAFEKVRIIGIDRDEQARKIAQERLHDYHDRIDIVADTYDHIPEILEDQKIQNVQGVLFDLGVSSLQLDQKERGFAYSYDTPLDMRMDQSAEKTAYDVVNSYSAPELIRVLRNYGQERFAQKIAFHILDYREKKEIETTNELVEIIRQSIPKKFQVKGGHPAKRTFQAIRVEVNEELDILDKAILRALDYLAVNGRVVVLSYQSLEDRIVKHAFKKVSTSTLPKEIPVELPQYQPEYKVLTKQEKVSEYEKNENSRAQAARLRAIERMRKVK